MQEIVATRVRYHRGDVSGQARVLAVFPAGGGRWAVVTDVTPFHPIDFAWPDQPGDHGTIAVGSDIARVVDTQILSLRHDTGEVRIGPEVSARRGDHDHVLAVAHIVDGSAAAWPGHAAQLNVDTERRMHLSAAHTGCHLVAYAFNEATDGLWSKEAPRDSRGSRNFDSAALIDSRHHLGGSVDRYRLGRSLRRKGFDHAALLADLDTYVARANDTLASWVNAKAEIHIIGDDLFTAERIWRCDVSTPPATMPCGGTHVAHLGEIASLTIATEYLADDKELRLVATSEVR